MDLIDTSTLFLGAPAPKYIALLGHQLFGPSDYIYPSSQVFSDSLILEGSSFYFHLQEIMTGKTVISLCSGDPRMSFHPEELAKLAKAKGYIAVDKNLSRYDYHASNPISPLEIYEDTTPYANQQREIILTDGTVFVSMFIEEELLIFLSRLAPSNGDRIFYISGIEPLMRDKLRRQKQVDTYLDYVCNELADKTISGDQIVVEISSDCIIQRLESSGLFEIGARGEYHICFIRKELK